MKYAGIALDIYCIVLSLLPTVYLIGSKRYRQRVNQYYLGVCIFNIFMITGNLVACVLYIGAGTAEKTVRIAEVVYYVSFAAVLYFLIRYIIEYVRFTGNSVKMIILCSVILAACGAAQAAVRQIPVLDVGGWTTVVLLIILINVQLKDEVKMKEQEKQLTGQRIDIMLSQIQPHFLYNSLGVIYHLCESDPKTARKAIKKFSEFLRGNMESLKNREPISFEKELNHVSNYLYLEQQRFGDKLQVIYQIKTDDFVIPTLTLQPLVENAVQHGILNRRGGGTVIIRSEETEQCAVVTVSDNGVGMEEAQKRPSLGEHSHSGIDNVRSRLKEMVGGSLDIESSGDGTTVIIRIPWTEGDGA